MLQEESADMSEGTDVPCNSAGTDQHCSSAISLQHARRKLHAVRSQSRQSIAVQVCSPMFIRNLKETAIGSCQESIMPAVCDAYLVLMSCRKIASHLQPCKASSAFTFLTVAYSRSAVRADISICIAWSGQADTICNCLRSDH